MTIGAHIFANYQHLDDLIGNPAIRNLFEIS